MEDNWNPIYALWKTFVSFWLLYIFDILQIIGQCLLVLVVFTETDAAVATGVMYSCYLIPAALNLFVSFKNRLSIEVISVDVIALISSIAVYIFSIVAYISNFDQTNGFTVVCMILCPILCTCNYWWCWVPLELSQLMFPHRSSNKNAREIPAEHRGRFALISSSLRLTASIVTSFIIYECCKGSRIGNFLQARLVNSSDGLWVLWSILFTIISAYMCFESCRIGAQRICMTAGLVVGSLVHAVVVTITCGYSKSGEGSFWMSGYGLTCVREVENEALQPLTWGIVTTGVTVIILGFIAQITTMAKQFRNPRLDEVLGEWSYLFRRDIFLDSGGIVDCLLMMNKSTLTRSEYENMGNFKKDRSLTKRIQKTARINKAYEKDKDDWVPGSHIENQFTSRSNKSRKQTTRATFARPKIARKGSIKPENEIIPYIYICPTLYRETKQEMRTLTRSILRLNRYCIVNATKQKNTNEQKYRFETNVFFDNCFITKNGKREINSFAEELLEVMQDVGQSVSFERTVKRVIKSILVYKILHVLAVLDCLLLVTV